MLDKPTEYVRVYDPVSKDQKVFGFILEIEPVERANWMLPEQKFSCLVHYAVVDESAKRATDLTDRVNEAAGILGDMDQSLDLKYVTSLIREEDIRDDMIAGAQFHAVIGSGFDSALRPVPGQWQNIPSAPYLTDMVIDGFDQYVADNAAAWIATKRQEYFSAMDVQETAPSSDGSL